MAVCGVLRHDGMCWIIVETEPKTIVLHAVTRGAVKDTAGTVQGQGWGWHVAWCLVVLWAKAAYCVL